MVAAVHYFASASDQSQLLDYLHESSTVSLHPWPLVDSPQVVLTREDAITRPQVMIANGELGPPSVVRPGSPAMKEPTKAGASID